MAVEQDIQRILNNQEAMDKKMDSLSDRLVSHDRTLYGTEQDPETGHSYRVKSLETVNKDRDDKRTKALLGITGISLAGGTFAAKFEAIIKIFTGG